MRTTTRARRAAAITVLATLAAGGLTACTDDTPEPTTSSGPSSTPSGATSGSPSSTDAFTPGDRSSVVLGAQLPAVQGTSKGTLDKKPATLTVAEVRAGATSTVLTFWYTGSEAQLVRRGELGWASWPTLVDTGAKTVYEPLTFVDDEGGTRCLCTDAGYIRGIPQPRTIAYPAIPASTTQVEVRQQGFDRPVTVPVTRD